MCGRGVGQVGHLTRVPHLIDIIGAWHSAIQLAQFRAPAS